MILRRLAHAVRYRLFPTAHEKLVQKWFADGGEEHLRYVYDLGPDSLVMDLGGFKGQFASDIFARYLCRVMVFEPVPAFAAKIRERFAGNPKISVFDFALGGRDREEEIRLAADGSSVFGNEGAQVRIRIVDAVAWLAAQANPLIHLMKVNIEGGEYELLERLLDHDLMNRVENLQVQFHDCLPDAARRMEEIQRRLGQTHEVTFQYRFVMENWRLRKRSDPGAAPR